MVLKKKQKPISLFILVIALAVLVYYAMISIWPFVYNIFLTFRKTDLIISNKFIGLRNYRFLIDDPIFYKALLHNGLYLGVLVAFGIGTSLIFAALIYKTKGIARKVYTAMFFTPVVTSMVAVSLVWRLLYFPKVGLFATIMSKLFSVNNEKLTFLQDPSIALICIIIMDTWKDTGIRTVILLAGMDEIPDFLYEAAKIEGASQLEQFFRITIPLLRPQLIFIAAIYSINALRVYVPVYMMTGTPPGGPAHSTQVLALQMYMEAFHGLRFGYGATISMVIFVILLGLVLLEIKAFQQKWEY
jgi:ABC-type sugar transport system permease subunit